MAAEKRKNKKAVPKKRRVVLLDAHAIIHRAYHALPEFTSASGEPTGALYGLAAMLIKIIQELKPDHLLAAYDLPEPTHRHEVYEAYKGTRSGIEEALVSQIERSRDMFNAFGIPVYEAAGFEADDIIGTAVSQLKKQTDIEVIIASGDLDTLQLVSGDDVQVYTLRKGLADTVMYNEEAVKERFSFGPELVVDYKGLRGDPSDNIPGVKGIGEKSATELLLAFGSIENIYETLEKKPERFEEAGIKPRVVKLLEEGKDDAVFSKMIATIRDDAPVSIDVPEQSWQTRVDTTKVLELFDELQFRTLAERVRSVFGVQGGETPAEAEAVDEEEFKQTAVALWLLNSDTTNPTLDDMLRAASAKNFAEAKEYIFAELKKTGSLARVYEEIEAPLIPVIERMQRDGVLLDTAYLNSLSNEYHKELDRISKRIFKHAGREFNVNSPRQLGEVLFDELGLAASGQKRTATGARSTKESELEKMRGAHPIIEDIFAYRELQKLLSTYIDNLPPMAGEDGRLHATFLQTGTTTGRMASQNPNLQNIPIRTEYGRRIRNAFTAASGFVIVALDYSQIELRIAAALSGDTKLIETFKQGEDIHTTVAAEVFDVAPDGVDAEMRRRAKVINFGILYGMGVNALRANLGAGVGRAEAAEFLSSYFKKFAGLAAYIEQVKVDAARNGYTETLFGRRRHFAGFQSALPYVRAQAERMAINAPIQGTQADIIKKAMVAIDADIENRKERESVKLVLQIHDELVYEVREDMAAVVGKRIEEIMEGIVDEVLLQGVPLVADMSIGPNWGELKRA